MIRIEHLPADIFGLQAVMRAALSGGLRNQGVATHARDLAVPAEAFLPAERAELAKWVEARATVHSPHVAVLESIRSLALPTASCVVHEASPAILAGPLEQLVGTLQAIVLARQLSTDEHPVVPVLWVQSDQPPGQSLITNRIVNRYEELQTVQLEELGPERTPLQRIELQDKRHGTGALRAVLSQLYGDYANITEALDIFVPRAGETLPHAFKRAMYEVFGAHGLIIIEPEDFREELARATADSLCASLHPNLEASAKSLAKQHGMAFDLDQAWLHLLDARGRQALHAGGEGYRFVDEPGSRTRSELVAEIVQSPRDWQAGPWLQSVARAAVLPVLAEVGGEQELARHLLLRDVRGAESWPSPGFVPRVHLSLLQASDHESLARLDLKLDAVLASRGQLCSTGEGADPAGLLQRIERIKRQAREQLAAEKGAVLDLDTRLASAVRCASRDVGRAFDQLSEKINHVQGDQSGRLRRHERRLMNGLCPDGEPQETRLSAFSWVASHGRQWIGELVDELDPFCAEHMAVHLD